ncbi:MAG TPA: hypothetical protein VGV15_10455, partial [Terriglobales bacterium]|nr:hypothetical protein [Terriglobales bacterium]
MHQPRSGGRGKPGASAPGRRTRKNESAFSRRHDFRNSLIQAPAILRVTKKTATAARQKSIFDLLFGRRLSSEEDVREQIGPAAGIPVFGLDALSSAAYGPEAALTILIPLGVAGLAYILPISLTIIVLLSIVYFSYRQTIAAYPNGGGSYIVATANLGQRAGLLAGAALMLDY